MIHVRTLRRAAALALVLLLGRGDPAAAHPAERYPETITPPPGPVVAQPGQTLTLWFTVTNHDATRTIGRDVRARCTWGGAPLSCAPTGTGVTLSPGASTQVGITFTVPGAGAGDVMLETWTGELEEADGVAVTAAVAGAAPTVDVASVNPGTSVERDLCLAVALGDAAASECGDLRLVHALPTVRTLNKDRTPVLLYNSGQAEPTPLVAASVTLPAGSGTPDSVTAVLLVGGVSRGRGRWAGGDWTQGQTRRIVVGYAAPDDPTGVYAYRLEVTNWYGATARTTAATGEMALVNRRWSTFGAGWWLAGLERLHFVPGGQRILWEGGDGSTRVYRPVPGAVNAAGNPTRFVVEQALDRADTLLRIDTAGPVRYVRRQHPGVRVVFGATGMHDSTVNRLGHVTRFVYAGDAPTRLAAIAVPAGPEYRFEYGAVGSWPARLWRVVLHAGTEQRAVVLGPQNGDPRVYSIHDPDGHRVEWGFTASSTDPRRPLWRRDRRGSVTSYAYDAAGKVTGSRLYMRTPLQPDTADIVLAIRPQESQGLTGLGTPGAVDTAAAHTLVDGPRVDVADVTRYYLDRWGAPRRVVDASLAETRIFRNDARWPVLPTRVEGPVLEDHTRSVTEAVYDARGNLATVTEIDPYRDGRNAVTRYTWNPVWGLVNRIVGPVGDTAVTILYDATNGNRIWQQDAGGTSTRVAFRYYAGGTAPGLLRAVDGPLTPSDSVEYDAMGNVSATVSPLRFRTTVLRDAFGRDTLTISPIDSAQTHHARQRNEYDVMGRVRMTEQWGPALPYVNTSFIAGKWVSTTEYTEAERLSVRNFHDPEGNLQLVERWATPDSSGIGIIATQWRFDNAGRPVAEVAPSGPGEPVRTDSTVFDHAGNAIRTIDRRGNQVTMRYDAAGRIVERNLPPVVYPRRTDPYGTPFGFPLYPNNGNSGWTIPGEQLTYGYDRAGNLATANNAAARITRTYNRNGTLASDSTHLARYDGVFEAALHGYALRYAYDLNGRRLSLEHPRPIAPVPGTAMWTRYGYNARGQLDSIYAPTGEPFAFGYDREGRLGTLNLPGGITETLTYNGESRRLTRTRAGGQMKRSGTAWFPYLYPTPPPPYHDQYRYDARGKAIRVLTPYDSTTHAYTALGTLVKRLHMGPDAARITEWMGADAFGNLRWTRLSIPYDVSRAQILERHGFQPGTGRQTSSTRRLAPNHAEQTTNAYILANIDPGGQFSGFQFDEAGNTSLAARSENFHYDINERKAYFYDASNRLRVVDRLTCGWNQTDCPNRFFHFDRGVFEEYRYDALGRRVLVRTLADRACPYADCDRAITRTVWDGDAVLYEMRSPGHVGAAAWQMEQDVGAVLTDPTHVGPFGRVLYVNGPTLDRPLAMLRMDYSPMWPEIRFVVPHANWRGLFEQGTDAAGSPTGHRADDTYLTPQQCRFSSPTGHNDCFVIDWEVNDTQTASYNTLAHGWMDGRGGPLVPQGWMGQSARQARDATGLMYRRNRYYDPATGRFTQEDPIGLTGGINLYGFGDGDPVNYSDPFGTAPRCIPEPCGTVLDAALLAADVADFRKNGLTWSNGIGMGLGAVSLALPVVSGLGAADDVGRRVLGFVPRLTQGNRRMGLEHIVFRHWHSAGVNGVSRFNRQTVGSARELRNLINEAARRGARQWSPQGTGRVLDVDMGRTIGTDGAGNAVSKLRIVVNAAGDVVTAYPIP